MSSILLFLGEGEQTNVRLVICPKCGRLVKQNSDCECDVFPQPFKKKWKIFSGKSRDYFCRSRIRVCTIGFWTMYSFRGKNYFYHSALLSLNISAILHRFLRFGYQIERVCWNEKCSQGHLGCKHKIPGCPRVWIRNTNPFWLELTPHHLVNK